MQSFPTTIVLRHKKENLKKCSLRGLESREDFQFLTYPQDAIPQLDNYIILAIDAPSLTQEDAQKGLFIIDATWRYAGQMLHKIAPITQQCTMRSIPRQYRTAYPRRQNDCPNPKYGLASIEAIYISYLLLGRDTIGLLDNYYWKETFLSNLQQAI